MTLECYWEPQSVLKRFSGFVTASELLRSVEEIQTDLRFDTISFVINDLLGVTGFEFCEETMIEFVVLHCCAYRANPYFKIIFVCTDANLVEAIRNVYKSPQLASYRIEILTTIAAARELQRRLPDINNFNNWRRFLA